MSVKEISANKRTTNIAALQLVRNDRHTQIVRFRVPKSEGGIDLSGLAWAVNIVNADGDTDVSYLGTGTVVDDIIVIDWTVGAVATACAGTTTFELQGVSGDDEDALVWQSAARTINVIEDVDANPSVDPQALTEVQTLIASVDLALNELIPSYNAQIAAAVAQAQAATNAVVTNVQALSETLTQLGTSKANASALAETDRKLDFLYKLNKGISYDFEQDTTSAYSKTIPSGAKQMDVQSIGGKCVVWNQLAKGYASNACTVTSLGDGTAEVNMTLASSRFGAAYNNLTMGFTANSGRKYLYYITAKLGTATYLSPQAYSSLGSVTQHSANSINVQGVWATSCCIFSVQDDNTFVLCQYHNHTNDNLPHTFIIKDTVTPIPIIDLTQLFGAGNEPTSTSDSRIAWIEQYASEHPEYNAGQVISADVSGVKVGGKNLFDTEKVWKASQNIFFGITGHYQFIQLEAGTYTYSVLDKLTGNTNLYCEDDSGTRVFTVYTRSNTTFTISRTMNVRFWIYKSEYENKTISECVSDFMLERGSSATAYTPYRTPVTRAIPSVVRALDGYGWSAGSVYNEVDFVNKKFIKRVGRYEVVSDINRVAISSSGELFTLNPNTFDMLRDTRNIISDKFVYDGRTSSYGTIRASGYKQFVINIGTITLQEAKEYLTANNPVIYYELETPVETDISAYLTDTDPIEVEAGGSVTMTNANKLAVPSKEEYLIALAEVDKMTEQQLKMLEAVGATVDDTEPHSVESCIAELERKVTELTSFVNALGKTELVGKGTAEDPFELVEGMNLVPNSYYIVNGVRYVYMGTATAYNGEELTFENGWTEF